MLYSRGTRAGARTGVCRLFWDTISCLMEPGAGVVVAPVLVV